jgi:hypothetical protein
MSKTKPKQSNESKPKSSGYYYDLAKGTKPINKPK